MNQLSMQNASVFHTFRQHSSWEIFSRLWHPHLPLLAQLCKLWKQEMKNHWNSLNAVERCDIYLNYWPRVRKNNTSAGYYQCLHNESKFNDYINGKCSEKECLDAIATCFLYNWPNAANILSNYCKLEDIGQQETATEEDYQSEQFQRYQCGRNCFLIATGKRSAELTELACNLFVIGRKDVQQAMVQMCAYGYKGIACFLAQEFSCTIEDLRIRDNYALYFAIFNNHLPVVQWLLRMFPYTSREVDEVLQRIEAPRRYSFNTQTELSKEMRLFVEGYLPRKEDQIY